MGLLEQWYKNAEAKRQDQNAAKEWEKYFETEKEIYAKLLENKPEKNTVKGYAEQYGVDLMTMVGFLDGINDSLKEKNPLENDLNEGTEVSLNYDTELLYKNMVAAKADWLYHLAQWDKHLSVERRKELYKEQKSSTTVVKEKKIGRNEPCPCGSGKKYKKCCGADI